MCNGWFSHLNMRIFVMSWKTSFQRKFWTSWSFRLECGSTRTVGSALSPLSKMYSCPRGTFFQSIPEAQFIHQPPSPRPPSSTLWAWGVHTGTASFPQRPHTERRCLHAAEQGDGRGSIGSGGTPYGGKKGSWKQAREGSSKAQRPGSPPLAESRAELYSTPIISLKTHILILNSSLPVGNQERDKCQLTLSQHWPL